MGDGSGDRVDEDFDLLRRQQIERMSQDATLRAVTQDWFMRATSHGYSYHFDVLGRPIIQFPQDVVALNELIWSVRPDVVIETGVARGGSIVNTAAQLALLDLSDAAESKGGFSSTMSRKVIGIDVDIRPATRSALESHFLHPWMELLTGSSTSPEIHEQVQSLVPASSRVMVLLDSDHTHGHVLSELHLYAPLVTPGSYCVVYDTVVEDMPAGYFQDRDWDVGNNPATAVREFLRETPDFVSDESIPSKLLVSVAPGGYLRRVSRNTP